MSELAKQSCVVLDHGCFLEVALRLARDVGKVYYVNPCWERAFATIEDAVIGDGFDEIERVAEIWDVVDKVDFCVFPDVHHSGMQLHLESLGMAVWGARKADELELKKAAFRAMQRQLGMKVPDYEVVRGLEKLREHCQDPAHDGEWIKLTPQFRGNRESFQNKGWKLTREILDQMGVDFGGIQDLLSFLCEKDINAPLEGGIDTYTVDGQHPGVAVQGYERKDQCYFAVVQPWDDLPKELTRINEYLWPELKQRRCRQMLSTEVKITEAGESLLLEPTVRFPSPAGEEQMELYGNFSEIIADGAAGKLREPDITDRFACEAMVEHNGDEEKPRSLQVPDEVRRWVKLYSTTKVRDTLIIAPGSNIIGAVVGIGNSPTEALEHLKEVAAALKGQPVTVHVEAIASVLQEIEEAQEQGIEFTKKPMPQPADAVEEKPQRLTL